MQHTETFALDKDGNPIKLVECTRLEPVDLSPIELSVVAYDGHEYRFRQPQELAVELDDETNQLYCIAKNQFGLVAYASTRDELLEEIGSQIHFLWQEYAQCATELLTPEATELKFALLQILVCDDAA